MKTLQIIIIAVLTLVTLTTKANNTNPIETSIVNTKTVQIKTNFVAAVNETYEIQRSYNNKNFKTVAVVFGSDDAASLPAMKLNDKVDTKVNTIYYRVIKLGNNGSSVVVGTSTVIAN